MTRLGRQRSSLRVGSSLAADHLEIVHRQIAHGEQTVEVEADIHTPLCEKPVDLTHELAHFT